MPKTSKETIIDVLLKGLTLLEVREIQVQFNQKYLITKVENLLLFKNVHFKILDYGFLPLENKTYHEA